MNAKMRMACVALSLVTVVAKAEDGSVSCDGAYTEYQYPLQQRGGGKTPHLPGCEGIAWLPDNGSLQLCREMSGETGFALVDNSGFMTWKGEQEEDFIQYRLKALVNGCGRKLVLMDRFGERQYGVSVYLYGSPSTRLVGVIPLVGDKESLVSQIEAANEGDAIIFRFSGDVYEWTGSSFSKINGQDVVYRYDGKILYKVASNDLQNNKNSPEIVGNE